MLLKRARMRKAQSIAALLRLCTILLLESTHHMRTLRPRRSFDSTSIQVYPCLRASCPPCVAFEAGSSSNEIACIVFRKVSIYPWRRDRVMAVGCWYVFGAYVDFMSGPRCMMRDESSESCRQGVRLTVGVGVASIPSTKSLCRYHRRKI
jgi:hypothetical protein